MERMLTLMVFQVQSEASVGNGHVRMRSHAVRFP